MWNFFKRAKAPKGINGNPNYDFRLGVRFDPGAQAEALEPLYENPVISFRGNGRLAGTLLVFQPPQIMFPGTRGTVGYGGIQHGQLIGQPLIDPAQIE